MMGNFPPLVERLLAAIRDLLAERLPTKGDPPSPLCEHGLHIGHRPGDDRCATPRGVRAGRHQRDREDAMRLWIVTNNWQGNGREGVIVQASDAETAVEVARFALIGHAKAAITTERSRHPEGSYWADQPTPHEEHLNERLATYQPGYDIGWRANPVTLPHIGEF